VKSWGEFSSAKDQSAQTIIAAQPASSAMALNKTPVTVVIGKSPGETLRKMGSAAYSLEAQRRDCFKKLNDNFGKNKWVLKHCFERNVSARVGETWGKQLARIINISQADGCTLATANVDRILRNARDYVTLRDSKLPLLICNDELVNTTTPWGRKYFATKVIEAEYEV
jgi:hypothetical protein